MAGLLAGAGGASAAGAGGASAAGAGASAAGAGAASGGFGSMLTKAIGARLASGGGGGSGGATDDANRFVAPVAFPEPNLISNNQQLADEQPVDNSRAFMMQLIGNMLRR